MSKIAAWFDRIIEQDVANPNESKKNAVMTRCICVVMQYYMTAQFLILLFAHRYVWMLLPLALLLGYIITFQLTRMGHTMGAHFLVICLMILWCGISSVLYGWTTGSQYMFFVILVFVFSGTHQTVTDKLLEAALFLSIGICIMVYSLYGTPRFPLSSEGMMLQEVLAMIAASAALILITLSFSKDTLDAERKLMEYNREVSEQARTDTLTGLMNRRAARDYFARIEKDFYQEGTAINVAIGDIDFFKQVNDTYGHDAGDAVLAFLSRVFREEMADSGIAARWGGEEFLFLITGMNGDYALMLLERLRHRIQHSDIPFGEKTMHVTMTFGVEEFGRGATLDQVIEAADRKLYMGKSRGRNQVVM